MNAIKPAIRLADCGGRPAPRLTTPCRSSRAIPTLDAGLKPKSGGALRAYWPRVRAGRIIPPGTCQPKKTPPPG
ncbi:MAG: hypothetical protein RI826_10120, partial [Chlorobium phaeovibrioides]|nr:hypothetical protein [Chlorobium phaeovibrioides]